MEKPAGLNFKVGQLAEMRTFQTGYRGAWFRCKIHDIILKENKIRLEYYDFDEEDISWVKIYQVPPYGKRSKYKKRQLMVRPQYPLLYHKNETPAVNSISQACVVVDGTWKVGDMVDWVKDDCYWSARIVKVLSDDKVQVELPLPPSGQGVEGEEGKHKVSCKDLRPSLDWSETKGWTFPTVEGRTSCDAELIFPTEQGIEVEHAAAAGSPLNASSTTPTSAEGDRDGESEQNDKKVNMDLEVEHAAVAETVSHVNASPTSHISAERDRDGESEQNDKNVVENAAAAATVLPVNASSTTRTSAEGDRDRESEQNVKMDCDLFVESSESTSSLRVGKRKATEKKRELNIIHEDTLDAAIIDLEELVNKVNWLQRLLQSPSNDSTTSSWKFA